MEYLLQREQQNLLSLFYLGGMLFIVTLMEARRFRIALRDRKATRRRRGKERPFPWGSACFLTLLTLLLALNTGYGIWQIRNFYLDKALEVLPQALGTARIEHVQPYRGASYDRLHLETDEGSTLTLRMPDMEMEDGAAYAVTYFPHTGILCDAEKLD